MIITYFRSSSFNGHNMCPQQYFCEYVLGRRGVGGIKADKGTIVHKVMEALAVAKKAKQEGKKLVEDNVCGKIFTNFCDINELTEKVYKYYSEAFDYHNWKEKDLKDCKDWVWKAIQLNDGMFDPRKRNIVDAEPHFDFEIDEDWANFEYEIGGETVKGKLSMKGTIDLITKVDDGVYEIIDWKTGKRLDWATGQVKTFEKLMDDPQLRIYHYAACQLYPDVKQIMITINFINDGGPFTICFSKEDLEKTKKMLRKKFEEIKSTKIPRLKKSWKCTKICHQGKTTFEGTDISPLTRDGKIMTKCEQVEYEIQKKGIDLVTLEYAAPEHKVTAYIAPGEI